MQDEQKKNPAERAKTGATGLRPGEPARPRPEGELREASAGAPAGAPADASANVAPEALPGALPGAFPDAFQDVARHNADAFQVAPENVPGRRDGSGQEIPSLEDLEDEHPTDLAEIIENLPLEDQVDILRKLPAESAADALVEMEEGARVDLLETLDTHTAVSLVSEMSPDDAADVLDELDAVDRDEILNNLEREDADEIRALMAFDPETAGGLMNTEIVILEEDQTVDAAIRQMRAEIEDKEVPYYAYVVDAGDRLRGVLSLREILLARKGTRLSDMLEGQNVISVKFDDDKTEVAQVMGDYNFMALPVVDHEGRLMGVITHDDVIDILNDMASEDMLGMVGAGMDESVDTPWPDSVKMRLPWLVVNMLNSSLSAFVVYLFEGSIAALPILAVFMPMVANQAGNTGQQALAVVIRQLALEKLDKKRALMAVRREAKVSLVNGGLLALLVFAVVYALTRNPVLTAVMVGALVMDMFLGALAGASIPLVLKRLGRDPAQASSIFLTAITDSAGFFIFLGLATLFLLA